MKLHELHVPQHGTGAIGHGVPVARRHQRVGGARVDLAGAAAREHHRPSQADGELALFAQRHRPHAATAVHEQVEDELVLVHLHPAAGGDHLGQRAGHDAAGGVSAGVHDASHGVGPLFAQDQPAVAPVEIGAQTLQLADARRALLDQHTHGRLVTQTDAGLQRVLAGAARKNRAGSWPPRCRLGRERWWSDRACPW